jgi:hypothetical protein
MRTTLAVAITTLLHALSAQGDPLACWQAKGNVGQELYGVDYLDGLWIVTGADAIITSRDGITWEDGYQSDPAQLRQFTAAASSPDTFVAVGLPINAGERPSGQTAFALSSDGLTWTAFELNQTAALTSVAYGNGVFVAVGSRGQDAVALVSTDGFEWLDAMDPNSAGFSSVIFAGDQFIAVGSSGRIATSPDGFSWEEQDSGTVQPLFSVAYADGLYVAGGAGGMIVTSPDSIHWKTQSSGQSADIKTLTFGAGTFVAGPSINGYVLSSTDGVQWKKHQMALGAFSATAMAYGAGVVTAVGYNPTIWQSESLLNGARPTFLIEPADQTVAFGTTVTLSALAAGCGTPDYQWYKSGSPIPGAVSSTLVLRNISGLDAANYSVAITDSFGSTLSRAAHLIVQPPTPLDLWQWRSPLPQGNDLVDLTYGGGHYVAVGDYSTVIESTDAIHWRVRGLNSDLRLRVTGFQNGLYLAGGYAIPNGPLTKTILLGSTDAQTWTELIHNIPDGVIFTRMAAGNGLFIAASYLIQGGVPTLWRSTDGKAWTSFSVQQPSGIMDLTFANGLFVAVGIGPNNKALILTSSDGLDWTTTFGPTPGALGAVAHGNGNFVALGKRIETPPASGFVLTSPDGITWEERAINFIPPEDLYASVFTYGVGQFLLLGHDLSGTPVISASPDGLIWNDQIVGPFGSLDVRAMIFDGSQFVAAGGQGNLAISTDASHWTIENSAFQLNLRAVAYGDGRYVAVGNGGQIRTSSDGASWRQQHNQIAANLHALVRGPDKWVAVGKGGVILNSSDGLSWTQAGDGITVDLFDVIYANGIYVAVGGGRTGDQLEFVVATSADGNSWKTVASGNGLRLHGLTYADQFIAVGEPGVIYTSPDAQNWQLKTIGTQYLRSISYLGGTYVAAGSSGTNEVVVSTNGRDWLSRPVPFPPPMRPELELNEVIALENEFLLIGDNGYIATSTDGSSWQLRASPTDINLRGATTGPNGVVIVGNNEVILQSGEVLSLTPVAKTANEFRLIVRGPLETLVQLQATDNLSPPDWKALQSVRISAGGTLATDRTATGTQRFYRVISP